MAESHSLDLSPALVPHFTPVPRRNTVTHGWTAAKQRGFIGALAATGSVRMATEAMGMSYCGVYKLRNAPGAESFARAWDAAVDIGARRVRDVLIDHAIHGVPECVRVGKTKVIERRRFNHRTMIWVLQHQMPDLYPGGSTTHRRGWGDDVDEDDELDRVRASILRKLEIVGRREKREIAANPAKRAAFELLNGPTDWETKSRGEAPPRA